MFKAGKAAADVDANAEDAIFALDLIRAESTKEHSNACVFIMWGRKKREKRDLARECLLVKPLSFWSQNTRKEETKKNKFFQRRQNSLFLAAKFI